jgi:hypothetical protein
VLVVRVHLNDYPSFHFVVLVSSRDNGDVPSSAEAPFHEFQQAQPGCFAH